MADYGFNFRATVAYVTETDSTISPVIVAGHGYPHTYANGATAGWTSSLTTTGDTAGVDSRDYFASTPYESSGNCQVPAASTKYFRVLLASSGDKTIRYSSGQKYTTPATNRIELFDDTTQFDVMTGGCSGSQFIDATHVVRTSRADWVSNNASLARTFSSSVCYMKVGDSAQGGHYITHLRITDAGGGAASFLPRPQPMAHMLVR